MALQLQNLKDKKKKLSKCNTSSFDNANNSFRHFVKKLKVNSFRHIEDLDISFQHPITVVSGTNKIGKTSILLLLACSFEQFMKLDSTSPNGELRVHAWKDVLRFTAHETANNDYSYEMEWRAGHQKLEGKGKRLASSQAWSGLGKKGRDRTNAKIRDRQVRLIDLERVLPGRSFTNALVKKVTGTKGTRLNNDVEEAFSYIFETSTVELREIGSHINKSCFLISHSSKTGTPYSSFNAASGEEAVIYLLRDVIESPVDSLILIDEIEAGFHPSVQRRIADIIQLIAWRDKKQFIVTTHSPTLISAFPKESRRFIEKVGGQYRVINSISHVAARSKMDSKSFPLARCYCEDELAKYLIKKILIEISTEHPYAERLLNIITSGPIDQVKNDYERHKRNSVQFINPIGYCAVFDGDHKDHPQYSNYFENSSEKTLFLYPHDAPEKFLIRAFLAENPNNALRSALEFNDHHSLFSHMQNLGLAADETDALHQCYEAFKISPEYVKHKEELKQFLKEILTTFSET